MTEKEALKLALEALENNKQKHHYCEDTWYSCPKHEDGCANEAEGDECNCGADEVNAQFDKAITAIKEALREHAMYEVQRLGQEIQPEQEPVIGTKTWFEDGKVVTQHLTAKDIYKEPEQIPPSAYSNTHQPEQEPVAWATREDFYRELDRSVNRMRRQMEIKGVVMRCANYDVALPVIDIREGHVLVGQVTTPPQRTWVGLTPQERDEINEQVYGAVPHHVAFHHALEAKLKEKNT
jgi:hypothetical protein